MPTPSPSTPNVSFEVFPPRDLAAAFRLWDTLGALAPLDPAFVSVTYGAGGQTRSLTHDAVTATGAHFGLPVAAHLTCVEASRAETLHIARRYRDAGVTHLVALRGDPPGGGAFEAHPAGFTSSRDLTEALARDGYGVPSQVQTFVDLEAVDAFDGGWANFSLLHAERAELPTPRAIPRPRRLQRTSPGSRPSSRPGQAAPSRSFSSSPRAFSASATPAPPKASTQS